jgi:hypothetical protein
MEYKPEDHGLSFDALLTKPPMTEEKIVQVASSLDATNTWLKSFAMYGEILVSAQQTKDLEHINIPRWGMDTELVLAASVLTQALSLTQAVRNVGNVATIKSIRDSMSRLGLPVESRRIRVRGGGTVVAYAFPGRGAVLNRLHANGVLTPEEYKEAVEYTNGDDSL